MANETAIKIYKYRWLIFTILALAYFFVYFHRLSLSVVANDIVQEFNSTASVMGLLGSIYFYCYAAMQLPAGLLSDSIGPRKAVTVFLMAASVGSVVFGLAPNINIACVGRILVGIGVSMVFTPTMKILSEWFRVTEFAMMAGILNAVGGAGAMAATWLLAAMTAAIGWRLSFILIGGCTFIIVALVWFIVRDRPSDKGWPSPMEIDSKGTAAAPKSDEIGLLEGFRKVIKEKYFWPVAIWFFFDCGMFFAFGGLWGGPYLMHVYDMTRAEAGAVLSMIAWGMILGSPFLGYLSDRILKSRKKVFLICAACLAFEMILLSIFPTGLPRPVLYFVFFFFSVFASSLVVIGFTMAKELFPLEIAGTSVGTVNLFPFLGGAVFMPVLGKILDAWPKTAAGAYDLKAYKVMLLVLAGSAIIALVCTFFMQETLEKQQSAKH